MLALAVALGVMTIVFMVKLRRVTQPTRTFGPTTPVAAWTVFQQAVRDHDYAGLWDVLSTRDHAAFASELRRHQSLSPAARAMVAAALGVASSQPASSPEGREELADRLAQLTPAEYFIRVCHNAAAKSPGNRFSGATLLRIEEAGSVARLVLQMSATQPDAPPTIVLAVREELVAPTTLPASTAPAQRDAWFITLYAK